MHKTYNNNEHFIITIVVILNTFSAFFLFLQFQEIRKKNTQLLVQFRRL
jgi:hypothetical protein